MLLFLISSCDVDVYSFHHSVDIGQKLAHPCLLVDSLAPDN